MSVSFLVAILFTGLANSDASTDPATAASPDQTLREWADAFRHQDAGRMAEFYENSADVIAIQSYGEIRRGIAEIRKEYEAAFDEVVFEKVSLEAVTVRQSTDVAWATSRFKALTVRKSDRTRWTLEIYTSFVLKRAGETWRIVLEQSTPIAGIPRAQRRR